MGNLSGAPSDWVNQHSGVVCGRLSAQNIAFACERYGVCLRNVRVPTDSRWAARELSHCGHGVCRLLHRIRYDRLLGRQLVPQRSQGTLNVRRTS